MPDSTQTLRRENRHWPTPVSYTHLETIKADITQFMREQLKLELSDEKTVITHAQDKAKLLGYGIFIRKSDAVKRNRDGVLKSCLLYTSAPVVNATEVNAFITYYKLKKVNRHEKT